MRPPRLRRALLALLAGLVALVAATSQAQAAFPGANGKIAFHTNRDGNNEIYTLNTDAPITSLTRLTNNAADDVQPAWSPDGTKLAFATSRDGNHEIYAMNADGTSPARLTNDPAADLQPAWSPDGTRIAFVTFRDGNWELYAMNADGTSPTRLTNTTAFDAAPAWSPDGSKIAFLTDRHGNYEIYKMNADGTGPTRLTNNSAYDADPAWSPNGAKIAFATNRAGGSDDIYTMNADGTSQALLTNFPGISVLRHPAWSPDGSRVAFATDNDAAFDIYSVGANGSNLEQLTDGPVDAWPDWQPAFRNYARPKGATPLRVPLTPAYKQCTTPNTTHQAPLSFGSCNPPRPESSFLTVGTPDFNGVGANSVGSVLFKVRTTAPEDGLINISMTDVRCQGTSGGCSSGALSDYSGHLRFEASFRITDKSNGGANPSGTTTDVPLSFAVPCTPTTSTTVGSTCATSTTINAVLGSSGIVPDKRAIWQLSGEVNLWDGGTIGVSGDPNATLFAVGGLFFP